MTQKVSIMKKIISTFTSILIFVCGFGIATAEQLQLTPVVQGSAVDQGPQDGVFDAISAPPNDRQLNNNGFEENRFAFEFDMDIVPVGAEILSAEVQVCISNFEGSRDVELHGYDANGMLELDDYVRNGFIGNKILQPTGFQILFFDVTNNIARITGNAIGFAGYNLRDVFIAGRPNFLGMFAEEQCILFPDSPRLVDFPRLVINIPDIPPLSIDIKPGKTPNSINPASMQKIPVAVLSADTFDATQVDPLTVAFGPSGAAESHGRSHIRDIDEDGDADLILHFNTQATGIQCSDTEATLTGETFGGQPVTGTDAINTVPCPGATYDFTQTFGNIEVSGTLTFAGSVPDSITVEDLNTRATWDLNFSTQIPGPVPLVPFTMSDSDSRWVAVADVGATFQIDASATELVFDLTTPFGTTAAVLLFSDDPLSISRFIFFQANLPGFVGTLVIIPAFTDPSAEVTVLPFDATLSFPVVSKGSSP